MGYHQVIGKEGMVKGDPTSNKGFALPPLCFCREFGEIGEKNKLRKALRYSRVLVGDNI
jgi:hypothetical protein